MYIHSAYIHTIRALTLARVTRERRVDTARLCIRLCWDFMINFHPCKSYTYARMRVGTYGMQISCIQSTQGTTTTTTRHDDDEKVTARVSGARGRRVINATTTKKTLRSIDHSARALHAQCRYILHITYIKRRSSKRVLRNFILRSMSAKAMHTECCRI